MITSDTIQKAASLYESKMGWTAIAETLGVDQSELRAACEKRAKRSLPDRAKVAEAVAAATAPRKILGFTVTKREYSGRRPTQWAELAPQLKAGDCVEGINWSGWSTHLRKELKKFGLTAKSIKRRNSEKCWDVFIMADK